MGRYDEHGGRRVVDVEVRHLRDYHWMDGAIRSDKHKNYSHRDLPKADETTYSATPPARSTRVDVAAQTTPDTDRPAHTTGNDTDKDV